ncbi:MAG TPA: sensory rhodopsin transducer, partial [Lentisphaeria bacterium]|nr:sensory rhodopsin transducer [Lentisphaeria bacterium]
MNGAKNWFFADGYLPAKTGSGAMQSHEALMLFNTLPNQVEVRLDIYFSDRPPIRDIRLIAPAERVISLRLDNPDDIG